LTGVQWLFALHVLSAVALGAAMTGFWVLLLATRPDPASIGQPTAERVARPLTVAVATGSLGTLVFGVWLAIVVDAYHPWDGWVIAAIVLWAVGTGLGQRAGVLLAEGRPELRGRGISLHAASSVAVLLVLVLMIWKPGS
jgi:hypothetical protein